MPPWARQPTTSYWPATTSPATSFGLKENGAPHLRQKPSLRPGWSSRPRPTGSPHRAQKRRFSATSALAMIASNGSRWGTAGTSIRPAPSWLRTLPVVRAVVARRARAVAEPLGRAVAAGGGGGGGSGSRRRDGLGGRCHAAEVAIAVSDLPRATRLGAVHRSASWYRVTSSAAAPRSVGAVYSARWARSNSSTTSRFSSARSDRALPW